MKTVEGKTALITGGAGGIGQGLARGLATRGARVCLADIDERRLEQAQEKLAPTGATIMTAELNVTSFADWERVVGEVADRLGPVDILCNNAGLGCEMQHVSHHAIDAWKHVIEVNLIGYFLGCRAVLPDLLERGTEGHIVNIASLSGLRAHPAMSAYGASKHGVVGLSDALRAETANTAVGITVVYPGMTRTNFINNSRNAFGDAVAEADGDKLDDAIASLLEKGMDPDRLGDRVVQAILAGEYHMFTHISDRPQIERIFSERLAAFTENADPDYADNLTALHQAISSNVGEG